MSSGPYRVQCSGNYTWIERNGQKISCVYVDTAKEDKKTMRLALELVELANRQLQEKA